MQDNKNEKKKDVKKLTLTVRNVEQLEVRSSPNTVCPDTGLSKACCRMTAHQYAAKLTAVAFF